MVAPPGELASPAAPSATTAASAVPAASSAIPSSIVDSELPDYQPVPGVSGSLKSIGSDTMSNLMSLWAEGFARYYPNVKIEVEGHGSSTAPPALIAGTADFGPMSRDLKSQEIDEFQAKFGYPPTTLAAGIDMLAVYVHRDNPIAGLSLPELDAIFSKNRKLGYDRDLRTWGDVGLPAPWDTRPISTYGRNAASGTYGYFKSKGLGGGDCKDSVKEQPGSSSVVQGVASERSGIGYSGIGYRTADVRAVPLASSLGGTPIAAEAAHAYSGEYPLARPLWLNLNYAPGSELDPVRREFIRYVFSKQGQQDVVRDGYLPVGAPLARQALAAVGLKLGS
ncbi:MAG: PstS family phosphate ABC transporter substrate-binding protein [Planctomycetaceae bacterium]|nr:PstS family phosphate ABC transporter substrate-binding protein [Planctomycetaceae bacterium]